MRAISKGPEPVELQQYRGKPRAYFDGIKKNVKKEICKALLEEQGSLCAYCMQRISENSMKVEHWHCRSRYPNEQLNYLNLLACCNGNKDQPSGNQHCDTKKGDRDIFLNPANPNHQSSMQIRYTGDGTICSDNIQFNKEIMEVLNLNWIGLKNDRISVLKAVTKALSKKKGKRTEAEIQALIRKWNRRDAGKLPAYCDVAIYYLEKKLRHMKSRKS